MGHRIAAPAPEFFPHTDRRGARSAVGKSRDASRRHGHARGPPRSAAHHRGRSPPRPTGFLATAVHLAICDGDGRKPYAARVDFHGLGDYGGGDPHRDCADSMVLAQGHERGRVVKETPALDIADLPTHGFGPRTTTWWG